MVVFAKDRPGNYHVQFAYSKPGLANTLPEERQVFAIFKKTGKSFSELRAWLCSDINTLSKIIAIGLPNNFTKLQFLSAEEAKLVVSEMAQVTGYPPHVRLLHQLAGALRKLI